MKPADTHTQLQPPLQRGLRLAGPLLAAATLLLLLVFYGRSSATLKIGERVGVELDAEVVDPPLEVSTTVKPVDFSTCGASATARGPHQRVASYSFYGDVNHARGYFKGIERNAATINELYPGWTMRVYHEVPPGVATVSSELDRLSREFPHLDLCYVGDIPGYGDLRGRQQNAWRFLAIADPLVDVLISRDLDALPLEREAAAVQEWLESNVTFHVMRDHKYHNVVILAGMWGVRPDLKRDAVKALAKLITLQPKGKKSMDQNLLAKHVWPAIKGDVWQHDAYHCERFRSHGHMRPFLTRRNQTSGYNFVGNRIGVDTKPMRIQCPSQCRPAEHQDWIYC